MIRLAAPLLQRLSPTAARRSAAGSGPADSRRALGLLGLLHYLWDETHLNTWAPGERRDWAVCHTRLAHEITDCTVNGTRLTDALYVVPPYRPSDVDRNAAAFHTFRDRLGRRDHAEHRGLILAEMRERTPTQHGQQFRLAHFRERVFVSAELFHRAIRSYPAAFSGLARIGRQIALLLVERRPAGYLAATDLAVMLTNRSYVPADSSHEIRLADALADARRRYIKPLRYDGDAVFPDFVLLDTPTPTYVEVYGVRGRETYETRKRAKQVHYRSIGAAVIEWDGAAPLPDLGLPQHPSAPGTR